MKRLWQHTALTVVPVTVALLLAFSSTVLAQVDTGTIAGSVKDPSGGVLPGVTITLTNEGTGTSQTSVTNAQGSYQFPALRSGAYSIAAELQGFTRVKHEKISLSIQQRVLIDLTLQIGGLQEAVVVTDAAPLLQTQDASVGMVIKSDEIGLLPLVSRNYTFLAQLNPGVIQGAPDGRGLGASGAFSANGQATSSNNYMLDGVDNNTNLSDFLNSANYVYKPAVEALQEFKVQTSSYSAELGRAGGAILNATLKSGTERYSGGVYEYLRDSAVDSTNYFDTANSLPKGLYQRHQFGGLLGGPLKFLTRGSVKTFFFTDYEGTESKQAITNILTTPTRRMFASNFTDFSDLILLQSGTNRDLLGRTTQLGQIFDPATTRRVTSGQVDPVTGRVATGTGFVREPFAGNIIPANRLNQNAVRLIKEMPLPLRDDIFGGNYVSQPILEEQNHQADIRIDSNVGTSHRVFVRGSYSRNPRENPPPYPGDVINGEIWNLGSQKITTRSVTAGWTWVVSPTVVSEWRVGYSDLDMTRRAFMEDDFTIAARFGLPSSNLPHYGGLPFVSVSGLGRLGIPDWLRTRETQSTPQMSANISKLTGNHSVRAGMSYQQPFTLFNQPRSVRGSSSYSGSFTDLAGSTSGNTGIAQLLIEPIRSTVPGGFDFVGGPSQVIASPYPDPIPQVAWGIWGVFGEDTWRVSPNMTLVLGLRYDYTQNAIIDGGFAGNFLYGNGPADRTPYTATERNPRYVMAKDQCNKNLSPSFLASMARDGIAIECASSNKLVGDQNNMISPRIGLSYQFHPRWVLRGGAGKFYQTSSTANILRTVTGNYPFSYNVTLNPANTTSTPIIFGDGSNATFNSGIAAVNVGDAAKFNATGLGMSGIPSPRVYPYTVQFNASLQHELSSTSSISMAYVGSRGFDGGLSYNYNAPRVMLPPSTSQTPFLEFPSFSQNSMGQDGYGAGTRYDSAQLSYQKRLSQGVSLNANYTRSKCENEGAGRAIWLIGPEWNLCATDAPNVVNVSTTIQLPFGQGRKFASGVSSVVNGIIGDWNVSVVGNYASGPPMTINCSPATTTGLGCYALLTGEPLYPENRGVDRWLNPAAFMNPPAATTIGQTDMSPLGGKPSQVRAPDFRKVDLSLQKTYRMAATKQVQLRADVSNLFDHPNFAAPGTNTNASGQPPPAGVTDFRNLTNFGKITSLRLQQNDQRQFQFALKLLF